MEKINWKQVEKDLVQCMTKFFEDKNFYVRDISFNPFIS